MNIAIINELVRRVARFVASVARRVVVVTVVGAGIAALTVVANEVIPAAQVEFNLDPVVTGQITAFVLLAIDALKARGS